MFKDKVADGELCPLLDRKCEERKCRFWIQVLGNHPQTGQPVERWNCTFAWQPILMIENSKLQRETGAAVESARNEAVRMTGQTNSLMSALVNLAHESRASLPPRRRPTIEVKG